MSRIKARTIAPLIAMGVTFLARKGMDYAYKTRTGHQPPQADDREVAISRAIGWAITTAVVSAVVEVAITRMAADCDATRFEQPAGADLTVSA